MSWLEKIKNILLMTIPLPLTRQFNLKTILFTQEISP